MTDKALITKNTHPSHFCYKATQISCNHAITSSPSVRASHTLCGGFCHKWNRRPAESPKVSIFPIFQSIYCPLILVQVVCSHSQQSKADIPSAVIKKEELRKIICQTSEATVGVSLEFCWNRLLVPDTGGFMERSVYGEEADLTTASLRLLHICVHTWSKLVLACAHWLSTYQWRVARSNQGNQPGLTELLILEVRKHYALPSETLSTTLAREHAQPNTRPVGRSLLTLQKEKSQAGS